MRALAKYLVTRRLVALITLNGIILLIAQSLVCSRRSLSRRSFGRRGLDRRIAQSDLPDVAQSWQDLCVSTLPNFAHYLH